MNLEVTNDGIAILKVEESEATLPVVEDLAGRLDHILKRGDIRSLLIYFNTFTDPTPASMLEMAEEETLFKNWQDTLLSILDLLDRLTLPLYISLNGTTGYTGLMFALNAKMVFVVESEFLNFKYPCGDLLPPYPLLPFLWERAGWGPTGDLILKKSSKRLLKHIPVNLLPDLLIRRYPLSYARRLIKMQSGPGRSVPGTTLVKKLYHRGMRFLQYKSLNSGDVERVYSSYHSQWLREEFSMPSYLQDARDDWCAKDNFLSLVHMVNEQLLVPETKLPDHLRRVLAVNTLPLSGQLLSRCSEKEIRIKLVEQRLENVTRFIDEFNPSMDLYTPSDTAAGLSRCDWLLLGEKEDHFLTELSNRMEESVPVTILNVLQPTAHYQKISKHPGFTIGLRLTPPVAEIVSGSKTRKSVRDWTTSVVRALGYIPLQVNDASGGAVNRIVSQYVNEALYLVEEGCGFAQIDRIFSRFGAGEPLKIADTFGNDALLIAAQEIARTRPHVLNLSDLYHVIVEHGHLGLKTEDGFYLYGGSGAVKENKKLYRYFGKSRKPSREVVEEDVIERLLFILVQDALRILDEGIVSDASHFDVALAHVIQFPRHLGGPLRYCEYLGWPHVASRLSRWKDEYGPRYVPSSSLMHLIESKKSIFEVEL